MGLTLLIAACSPTASESSPPSSGVPQASEARPSGSEGVAACDPGVVCGGPLVPGRYVSDTTGAHVVFTLNGDGWSGLADTDGDGFALFRDDVEGRNEISFASFSGGIFTDACSGDATSTIGATPDDFMTFLAARTGVTTAEPVEIQVGGRPAIQVDLTTQISTACEATGHGWIWLWTLPVHGDFHFNADETVRVMAVDAGSAIVIIVVEAFLGADYQTLLERAQDVVDTMTIEPL